MSKIKKFNDKRVRELAITLNSLDAKARETLLGNIANEAPELAEELQKKMFTFEDLIRLEARDMQLVLQKISPSQLALALRTASEPLKEFIFKNMSIRAAQIIRDEMNSQGPQRKADVEAAQTEIVRLAKQISEWES